MTNPGFFEQAAMNGLTGGNPGPRRAVVLAVAAAVAVLTTARGLMHVHFGSSGGAAPTGPAAYRAELANAQCMRARGLADSMCGLSAERPRVVNTLAPGAVIREVVIPSSYTVADVALSIRQDTGRRDRGTGQLAAGS